MVLQGKLEREAPRRQPEINRLGSFHLVLNFFAALGKRYQSSGIEDLLIESNTYAPGTVMSLMKGKS